MHNAMRQYTHVNKETDVAAANPHRLIQLLLEGALQRIAEARGHLQRRDSALLGESLGKALGIISGLQASLNREAGGEIAANLHDLYDYMARTLLRVHVEKTEDALVEVSGLLIEIKTAWEAIQPQAALAAE